MNWIEVWMNTKLAIGTILNGNSDHIAIWGAEKNSGYWLT